MSSCSPEQTVSCIMICIILASAKAVVMQKTDKDHESLLAFKREVTLDPYHVFSSWNASLHFCSWPGVTCGRRHQRVTALDLPSSGLGGTLTPHLGNLSFLAQIDLANNSFGGEISSQFGRLFRLQNLFLFNNSFQGSIPSSLSNCSRLNILNLGNNQLTGHIPTELGYLSRLQWLNLQMNPLSGSIPPSLGNLSSLHRLALGGCNLVGTIPLELGRLSKVQYFGLFANQLQGHVPPAIYNMSTSLQRFQIQVNNLTGRLPTQLFDTGLPKGLLVFSVANNQMTGPLPPWLWNLTQLLTLDVRSNNFVGSVPDQIGRLGNLLRLNFGGNKLGGGVEGKDLEFISHLNNCTNLSYFEANLNNFYGLLPISIANLSKSLQYMNLGFNNIYGTIHPEISSLVSLNYLLLVGNMLNGTIPSSLVEMQRLEYLYLGENMLTGQIPSSLGNLSRLLTLDLKTNKLQGYIPSTVGNCTNLDELDLSDNELIGAVPPSLAGCAKLRKLDLSKNSLTSTIPSTLLSFSSLDILNLSYNLLTGPLHGEVGTLRNIHGLYVSGNQLSGNIPASLGSCLTLENLYTDGNAFEGAVPDKIADLKGLQRVDLSRNKLNGQIPDYFTKFRYLNYLNLSYNQFEGNVPIGGIFNDSSAIFLQGNAKLCGGISDLHFQACAHGKSKRRKKLIQVIILTLAASIVLTIGLCAVFIFRRRLTLRKKGGASSESLKEITMKVVSYRDIINATNNFSSSNLIGTGSFGVVYKGVMDADQMVVAVKVFNLEQIGASKSFLAECAALQNIRHRNLVKILTCCSGYDYKDQEFKALVYEFMENGTLESWLHPETGSSSGHSKYLSLRARLDIAIDVACALDYLHNQCHTSIIHCDLKPNNILLDGNMVAHVSDFGLAKILLTNGEESSQLSSSLKGTLGYIPPEYGAGGYVTTQGDLFSFGIILLEMLTGKRPTDEMFQDGLTISCYAKKAYPEQVMEIVDHRLLSELPLSSDLIASLLRVGIECSSENPNDRLEIEVAKNKLEIAREKLPHVEKH